MAELAQGRSVESVAARHGVKAARLRWWRWRLATPASTALAVTRMVEVLRPEAPLAEPGLRIRVGQAVLELPTQVSAEYVGRVLAVAGAAC